MTTILRKSYTRKAYIRKNGTRVKRTRVPASRIKDRGLPGKGKKLFSLKKGTLTQYGYDSTASAKSRRRSLRKAVKKYGALSISKKLNAVSVLTKRTAPGKSKTFKSDQKWVSKTYLKSRRVVSRRRITRRVSRRRM